MTNPFYGSSLFQARKTEHLHQHSHLHNRKSQSAHARSHADFHNRRQETADLDPRGSAITEVVQTISVVQIIDGAGATLSAQTLVGSSQTDLVDGETGSTIAVNYKAAVTTSSDADAPTTSVSAVSSVDPVSATDYSTTSTDAATTTPAALSLTHISSSLSASSFSTLSSTSNSTTSSLTSSFVSSSSIPSSLLSTASPSNSSSTSSTDSATFTPSQSFLSGSFASSVASTTFASSTTASISSPFSSSTTWSGDSSSTGWLSPSDSAASSAGGAGGSGATSTAAGTSSTSAAAGSSGDTTSTQTSKVAGGIVGGIAGIALLVGLAFMILRMRKRGWCHMRLGGGVDEPDAAARRALPAPSAGDGGNGAESTGAYGTMQQRSAPQAVAASLAALAGKRSSRERAGSGPEMAERGFVRVSGKKLPPVLQYGGDGYSDPRDNRASHMSDASASVYRDSMAVFDQPNHQRLALGSPMRPESGIMTMHPGPARTPVTGQVPRAIDSPTLPRSSTFPATDALGRTLESEGFSRDAIGRTLAAHDHSRDGAGSRGSHNSRGSTRFTEHVT